MTDTPDDPRTFSRRSFLKGASAAAVAGSVATNLTPAAGTVPKTGAKTYGKGTHRITLQVNGTKRTVEVETRTTLLDALRDRMDLTGSKKICDRGTCGGCTAIVDGEPVNTCLMLAFDAVGSEIRTIEGLADGDKLHPLQEVFVECDALQCGFCTPGMVMAGVACLEKYRRPSLEQIREEMSGNLCRCGTYGRIFEAVQKASTRGVYEAAAKKKGVIR